MRRIALALALTVAGHVSSAPAHAHGSHDARMEKLDDQLREAPTNTVLLLQRAELQLQHGDPGSALRDCDAVAAIDPSSHDLDRMLGRIHLALDRPADALFHADRWAESAPRFAAPHRLRARALAAQSRFAESAAAMARAVDAADPRPSPDDVLALARYRHRADPHDVEGVVAALDAGLAKLGALPVLNVEAVRVLRESGRWDEAISRTFAPFAISDDWANLALRGDLWRDAGRHLPAMDAYSESLAAIEGLPASRRAMPAIDRVRRRLHAELESLGDELDSPRVPRREVK